jgi:hypothetical protein
MADAGGRAPFECVCGFTAGTSFAWEKHLALRNTPYSTVRHQRVMKGSSDREPDMHIREYGSSELSSSPRSSSDTLPYPTPKGKPGSFYQMNECAAPRSPLSTSWRRTSLLSSAPFFCIIPCHFCLFCRLVPHTGGKPEVYAQPARAGCWDVSPTPWAAPTSARTPSYTTFAIFCGVTLAAFFSGKGLP